MLTNYRRAVDVLRVATEPLTAREIAERVLAAAKVTNPKKAALADLAVTGSGAFARFRGVPPTLEHLKQSCHGVPDAALNRALDRAYAVAVNG